MEFVGIQNTYAESGTPEGLLDKYGLVAREVIAKRNARSNFLGYHGFPAVVCTSPNDVIVHGIPSADVVLQEGDILSIDCGAIIEGWHADAAVTVPIGEVDDESTRHTVATQDGEEPRLRPLREAREAGVVDEGQVWSVGAGHRQSRGAPRAPCAAFC